MYDISNSQSDVSLVLEKMKPVVSKMAQQPNNWWQRRKRYSRLAANLAKAHIIGRLNEIKFKGSSEARKSIEKRILSKKTELPREIIEIVDQNKAKWSNFIYDLAAKYPSEKLAGFFVPFIYGGFMTQRNASGEAFGIVDFSTDKQKYREIGINERILNAARTIEQLKSRGICSIIVEGDRDEVYSRELRRIYYNSPDNVFIIFEREGGEAPIGGQSAYPRDMLTELGHINNIFVILEPRESREKIQTTSGWFDASHKALQSYGIPHGISTSAAKASDNGCIAIFDSAFSFEKLLDSELLREYNAEKIVDRIGREEHQRFGKRTGHTFEGGSYNPEIAKIISLLPSELFDFIKNPKSPVVLPNFYALCVIAQYFLSAGRISDVTKYKV